MDCLCKDNALGRTYKSAPTCCGTFSTVPFIYLVYGNHTDGEGVGIVKGFKMVGANSHVRPNALRLHNRYIYPFRLW